MVERAPSELPLTLQAALLGLSRSSLYYRPVPPSPEEVALKHRIDEIYNGASLLWLSAHRRPVAS